MYRFTDGFFAVDVRVFAVQVSLRVAVDPTFSGEEPRLGRRNAKTDMKRSFFPEMPTNLNLRVGATFSTSIFYAVTVIPFLGIFHVKLI